MFLKLYIFILFSDAQDSAHDLNSSDTISKLHAIPIHMWHKNNT
jgi:hypothetical protein